MGKRGPQKLPTGLAPQPYRSHPSQGWPWLTPRSPDERTLVTGDPPNRTLRRGLGDSVAQDRHCTKRSASTCVTGPRWLSILGWPRSPA